MPDIVLPLIYTSYFSQHVVGMVFTETIIPVGAILYKGLKRGVTCQTLLKDTKVFYLTDERDTARSYGNLCPYRAKHKLRLFDITHPNIDILIKNYPLKSETKTMLRLITGTGLTLGQQGQAFKRILGKDAGKVPNASNTRRGQRSSYTELNKRVFGSLIKEFFIPEGYDGYYSGAKKSVFHSGSFHSEIMVNNAYRSLERVSGKERLPIISGHSIKWAIPRIFAEFSKGTTRLVRPYKGFTIFCTGGMAVRMYLQQRRAALPPAIRRTSDYDFTFGLPRKVKSEKQLNMYVYHMRNIMSAHMNSFIKYLNRNYTGCNARLKIIRRAKSKFDNPRLQIPTTKRSIYQVISYQVVTGKNTTTDIVDTALAVYPGAKREDLHLPYSYKLGIPIQKVRYQFKDALAILAGSFIHKGLISKRNPIIGDAKNKGVKNTVRVERFLRVIAKDKKHYANLIPAAKKAVPLLESILSKNLIKARKNALNAERAVKHIH
jgi:hypothetical protein